MFDTHLHSIAPSYPQHITKTEQRAPTDASVRLLDEFQQRAEARIVETLKLENNVIFGIIHRRESPLDLQNFWRAIFKINGQNHTVDLKTDVDLPREEQIREVYQAIAEEISRTLFQNFKWK